VNDGRGMRGHESPDAPRAEAMSGSVVATALRKGVLPGDVDLLRRGLAVAMEPRLARIDDDHHPAFLHPGRTALILLHDVAPVPVRSLRAAVLLESRDAEYAPARERVLELLPEDEGEEWASLADLVRDRQSESLAERLVTLPPEHLLAALAERLDHLRHEHLREPATSWRDLVDETERLWAPLAERTSPALTRRYRHWLRTFRRRL